MTRYVVAEAIGAVDTWYVLKDCIDGPVMWEEPTRAAAERAAEYFRIGQLPPRYATEPTECGNQTVIPDCERDKRRGPKQMDLF